MRPRLSDLTQFPAMMPDLASLLTKIRAKQHGSPKWQDACNRLRPMKYLMILLAVVVVGLALLAPQRLDLFPERPYSGAYAGN